MAPILKLFKLSKGDSMMYHNSVSGVGGNGNGTCSQGSPNRTPPNINACSSTTPPLTSGQTNQSDGSGNDMVKNSLNLIIDLINI